MAGPMQGGNTPEDRKSTREQLWAAVQDAKAEHKKTSAAFDLVIMDLPSKIPASDGVYRIQQARQARWVAFEKYERALAAFTKFVMSQKPQKISN